MTIPTLFETLSGIRTPLILIPFAIPVVTLLMGFVHDLYGGRKSPWRQIYGYTVVLTTGAMAGYFTVYFSVRLFSSTNPVMDPLVAAVIVTVWLLTLIVVKRAVDYRHLAGFVDITLLIIEWIAVWIGSTWLVFSFGAWLPFGAVLEVGAVAVVAFMILNGILCRVFGGGRG